MKERESSVVFHSGPLSLLSADPEGPVVLPRGPAEQLCLCSVARKEEGTACPWEDGWGSSLERQKVSSGSG